MCSPVILNGLRVPQAEDAKYLGLYMDHRQNWKRHIFTKRKQFGFQLGKMYWLLGSKSSSNGSNCRLKTSCYYTKQSSNLFGSMANYVIGSPILI
jgi:hypothetical protein